MKWLFKKESLIESTGIILLFTFGDSIIRLLRGVLFARLLGPEEYGVYTLAFFIIPFIAIFAQIGIPYCLPRYIPQYAAKGMLKDFLKKTYRLTVMGSIGISLLCLLFSKQVSILIFNSTQYQSLIYICAAIIPLFVLREDLRFTFNGLRIFKIGSFLNFSNGLIFAALGIFALAWRPEAKVAILAFMVSCLLVLGFVGFLFKTYLAQTTDQNSPIQESRFYRKILNYSLWLVLSPVVFTMFSYVDRWMVNRYLGMHPVGIYSAGANLAGILFIFGAIAGNVLMPKLSEQWEQGEKKLVISTLDFGLRLMTLFILILAFIVFLFRKPIILILFGSEYLESCTVVGALLIFRVLNTVFWFICGYAGLIEKTHIPLVVRSGGLILNIVLNFIFIPIYGIQGAAMASAISVAVSLPMVYYWLNRKGLKIKLNTIFLCSLPVIFILGDIFVMVSLLVLPISIIASSLWLSYEEKQLIRNQLRSVVRRYIQGA